jgi:hypothetical protein
MAITKILLNVVLGCRICHDCGLSQGDPFSPMLFVLVMECFNVMIKLVDSKGLFNPLRPNSIKQQISLYADDVVVFLSPVVVDLIVIREIMNFFRCATRLAANLNKSKAFLIRCTKDQLGLITRTLGCLCADFPCTYYGCRFPLGACPNPLCSRSLTRSLNGYLLGREGC